MTIKAKKETQWWPIALSEEITTTEPVSRTLQGQKYVLFRDKKGVVRALEDRCGHRRAALSLGKITPDGFVECPYHGWRFRGNDGKCMAIPNLLKSEKVPDQYAIHYFVTTEHQGLIYIWPDADQSALPLATMPALPAVQQVNQGSTLITLNLSALLSTLYDGPSLLMTINGVDIIDDHIYGEPVLTDGGFIIERAADWSSVAKRRKKVVANYPLYLRTTTLQNGAYTSIELLTDYQQPLLTACIAMSAVKASISSIHWRVVRHNVINNQWSASINKTAAQLTLNVRNWVDANKLIGLHPYASNVWQDTQPDNLSVTTVR